jgi:hypothetical protein
MRFILVVTALVGAALVLGCAPSSPPKEPDAAPPSAAGPTDAASGTTPAGAPSKLEPAGGTCGGIAGVGCNKGLYCLFPPEAQCGAADQTGTCQPVGDMCTQEFAPVCGCNDKTYPNACYAAREGVSVLRKGECAAQQAPQ